MGTVSQTSTILGYIFRSSSTAVELCVYTEDRLLLRHGRKRLGGESELSVNEVNINTGGKEQLVEHVALGRTTGSHL